MCISYIWIAGRWKDASSTISTVVDQHRSRNVNRSRSPSRHGKDAVYKSPLGTGEMLTREEFERLQHSLRMNESILAPPGHSTFTAEPLRFPHSVHHPPPHMMYPAPGPAASGQHLPPPHGTVILTRQPIMMHEQPRPFPGPGMEPLRLHHDPQLGVPPQVPIAQPLPPPGVAYEQPRPFPGPAMEPPRLQPLPPPGVLHHGPPPPGHVLVMTSGNPQLGAQLPPPNSLQFQPR